MDDLRKRTLRRHEALKKERSSWVEEWRGIARHVLPSTGRFLTGERNNGRKEFNKILDNEATRSVRILGAGLMSGMTSPARPWFRLATANPEMMTQALLPPRSPTGRPKAKCRSSYGSTTPKNR